MQLRQATTHRKRTSTRWKPRSSCGPGRWPTPDASSRRATRSWPPLRALPGARSLKTNFFANVSHELRTPLALILAPAERVLAELAPDDPHRRDLEVVLRNARPCSATSTTCSMRPSSKRPSSTSTTTRSTSRPGTAHRQQLRDAGRRPGRRAAGAGADPPCRRRSTRPACSRCSSTCCPTRSSSHRRTVGCGSS